MVNCWDKQGEIYIKLRSVFPSWGAWQVEGLRGIDMSYSVDYLTTG
jgi:hypothetical protein